MRIAIPLVQGRLSPHFGHCEEFALLDADPEKKTIVAERMLTPPPHAPGLLPRWLAEQGATVIVAGGMGSRAQDLFTQNGIEVVLGAPNQESKVIAERFLSGTLETGENACDH